MTGGARKNSRALAIAALAAGHKRVEAAAQAGVSESSIYRWQRSSSFVQEVRTQQAETLGRVAALLANVSTLAVVRLEALLNAQSEAVRLGAVRTTFEFAGRLRDSVELSERLAELERLVSSQQPGARR